MNIPLSNKPKITQQDIANGVVTRYFTRNVSSNIVTEIDKKQYDAFRRNALYQTFSIDWIISGYANDALSRDGTIIRGTRHKNSVTVEFYNKMYPGLSRILRSPLEYFAGIMNKEIVNPNAQSTEFVLAPGITVPTSSVTPTPIPPSPIYTLERSVLGRLYSFSNRPMDGVTLPLSSSYFTQIESSSAGTLSLTTDNSLQISTAGRVTIAPTGSQDIRDVFQQLHWSNGTSAFNNVSTAMLTFRGSTYQFNLFRNKLVSTCTQWGAVNVSASIQEVVGGQVTSSAVAGAPVTKFVSVLSSYASGSFFESGEFHKSYDNPLIRYMSASVKSVNSAGKYGLTINVGGNGFGVFDAYHVMTSKTIRVNWSSYVDEGDSWYIALLRESGELLTTSSISTGSFNQIDAIQNKISFPDPAIIEVRRTSDNEVLFWGIPDEHVWGGDVWDVVQVPIQPSPEPPTYTVTGSLVAYDSFTGANGTVLTTRTYGDLAFLNYQEGPNFTPGMQIQGNRAQAINSNNSPYVMNTAGIINDNFVVYVDSLPATYSSGMTDGLVFRANTSAVGTSTWNAILVGFTITGTAPNTVVSPAIVRQNLGTTSTIYSWATTPANSSQTQGPVSIPNYSTLGRRFKVIVQGRFFTIIIEPYGGGAPEHIWRVETTLLFDSYVGTANHNRVGIVATTGAGRSRYDNLTVADLGTPSEPRNFSVISSERTQLGRLVALQSASIASASSTFTPSDFQTSSPTTVATSSGNLVVSFPSGAFTTLTSYTPVGNVDDVYMQVRASARSGQVSFGPTINISADSASYAVASIPNGFTGTLQTREVVSGSTRQFVNNAATINVNVPQRIFISKQNDTIVSYVNATNINSAYTLPTSSILDTGKVGLFMSKNNASAASMTITDFIVMRGTTIRIVASQVVAFYAVLLNQAGTILNRTYSSGGEVVIDTLAARINFPDVTKIEIRNVFGDLLHSIEPTERIWAGDVWNLNVQVNT